MADADVCRRSMVKENGFKYYEYMLWYVDDCLVICHKPKELAKVLKSELCNYTLKDEGSPERYLGAKVRTF